ACTINLNSKVTSITKNEDKYKVHINDTNSDELFDEIVMCTNAEIAASILSNMQSMSSVCRVLQSVGYYDTTLCFHEAPDNKMFNKNLVIHTVYDGNIATNHATKHWNSNIMKSWVLDNKFPEKHYDIVHYRHPYMDEPFYNAQECMESHNNLQD